MKNYVVILSDGNFAPVQAHNLLEAYDVAATEFDTLFVVSIICLTDLNFSENESE